jgi:hypothetical protein
MHVRWRRCGRCSSRRSPMDESAMERMRRDALLRAFRDGHESCSEARCITCLDTCFDSQLDCQLDPYPDAHLGPRSIRVARLNGRARCSAAAAVGVLAGIAPVLDARSNGGESGPARFTAMPVYWSRLVDSVRLDIRRRSCDGCTRGGSTGSRSRHRPQRREGRYQSGRRSSWRESSACRRRSLCPRPSRRWRRR